MVCTLIYHKSDVKMFKTQVELGVGSFRSLKNSVDFFTVTSIDNFWRPFLLKFLGDSLRKERGKLRRHFVFSMVCTWKLKTLRYLKMYYHHNGHFAINIPICLISINALAITTTGFDQHRVGKPHELSRETEVLMVIAKSRLVTVSASYNLLYQHLATSCSVEAL